MKSTLSLAILFCAGALAAWQISNRGLDLLRQFESWKADAYWDPNAKVWAIGYGSTRYENGQLVKQGDRISLERAAQLLRWEANKRAAEVARLLNGVSLNQNQMDALVSFAYNVGSGALGNSMLLRKIRTNARDLTIRDEFMRYSNSASGRVPALVNRRKAEADLYFS